MSLFPVPQGLPAPSRCNTRRVSSEASMLSTGLFSGRSMSLSPTHISSPVKPNPAETTRSGSWLNMALTDW